MSSRDRVRVAHRSVSNDSGDLDRIAEILKSGETTVEAALKAARRRELMREKLTVYIDPEILAELRDLADESSVTLGSIVERAIRRALRSAKPPRGPEAALPVARKLRKEGYTLGTIATELNVKRYQTARGRPWNALSVSRLLD